MPASTTGGRLLARLFPCLLLPAAQAYCLQGPQFLSFRALGMGNASVALAQGRQALDYNPAGLALGDAREARVTLFGTDAPWAQARDLWGARERPWNGYSVGLGQPDSGNGSDVLSDAGWFSEVEVAALQAFDMTRPGLGLAYRVESRAVIQAGDPGLLLADYHVYEWVTTQATLQVGLASRRFQNGHLIVGAAYRLTMRRERTRQNDYGFSTDEWPLFGYEPPEHEPTARGAQDAAHAEMYRAMVTPWDFDEYEHGADFGALWLPASWLRFGTAAQNVGARLDGTTVTPELTAGFAATLPLLSTQGRWFREVNVAADYENILDDGNGPYLPFSHVNFGAEIEQYLGSSFAVGAGGGFKGGYWTATLRTRLFKYVLLETASWAEELGTFTGDHEMRHYALALSLVL